MLFFSRGKGLTLKIDVCVNMFVLCLHTDWLCGLTWNKFFCVWAILLKTGPKRVPLLQWNKIKTWNLLNCHYIFYVMCLEKYGKCHNVWMHHYFLCCESFFGTNHDIFMAVICDMAKGRLADYRYYLESIHDWIKTDFMRNKVASSYIQMISIVCCFLLAASPLQKKKR